MFSATDSILKAHRFKSQPTTAQLPWVSGSYERVSWHYLLLLSTDTKLISKTSYSKQSIALVPTNKLTITKDRGRSTIWERGFIRGSGGWKTPSGIQGQSPNRKSGAQSLLP